MQVKLKNDFNGSLRSLNRGQFKDVLWERHPCSECPREKAVFVDA